ncbi:MAG: hypothetical protein ACOYMG_27130 [Candidatus Methylumidiphilus sp.]
MRSARTSFIAWLALLVMMLSIPAYANTVYSQPPLAAGITQSSYADAAAMDMGYVFCDNFTTTATQTGSISNITWQGQDNPNTGFTIVILNAQPSAPDTTTSPSVVAKITVPDNSSRIKTANANGLYDYYMNLPTPFVLQPNTS